MFLDWVVWCSRARRLSKPAALAGLVTLAAESPTFAQGQDSAASETLFRDGKRLLDQKDYERACPKLAESFRLEPATGTLLALAMCHEGQGRIATAWAEYADAAARARREGRPDREQAAREWAGALESRLSTMTISVSDAAAKTAGLEVKRDGVVVGTGAWGTAVPVDPGEHVIEAVAPGKKPWTRTVAVRAASSRETLMVPALEDVSRSQPLPVEEGKRGISPLQQTGLVFGGLGVVALGVGTFYGLQAIRKNDNSKAGCDDTGCDPAAKQERLEARTAGNVSTFSFIGGGALVIGGAVMYFAGASSAPKHGVRVLPAAGRATLGVAVAGSF